MEAVAMVVAGFVIGQLGEVPFAFRATNMTMEECRRTARQMRDQITQGGAKVTFVTGEPCSAQPQRRLKR